MQGDPLAAAATSSRARRRPRTPLEVADMSTQQRGGAKLHRYTAKELAMRFAVWMQGRAKPPCYRLVMDHFTVSRATAYRLLQTYRDATGQEPTAREVR